MKRTIILIGCFFVSNLIVALLWFASEKDVGSSNSFHRRLPPHIITPANILDLKSHGNYIAGFHNGYIYISNFYLPNKLFQVDSSMSHLTTKTFSFPYSTNLLAGCFNLVDSTFIYLFDGNQPAIFQASLANQKFAGTLKPPYFTQAVHTTRNTFALRVVLNGKNELVQYQADSKGFKVASNLLSKQIDGIFCTDGSLIKVPRSNKIIYLYYYRNQFICTDNNLKLIYTGKTIDTNAHAKIKVSYIKSSNQTTLSAPPVYVNKQAAANNKYLFIVSGLRADNEQGASLDGFSTIDVYKVHNGKYQFSFYLPDFNKKKLTDFRVDEHSLYALYDHYLYRYQLNF